MKRKFTFRPGSGFYWVMEWYAGVYSPIMAPDIRQIRVGPFDTLDAAWFARRGVG